MKSTRILASLIFISLPGLAAADQVFNDNVTIRTLGPILRFDDTSGSDADWRLCVDSTSGCSTDQDFAIRWDDPDPASNGTPFVIENGTGNNLLRLSSSNRIGINTSTPGYTVDAVGSGIRARSGTKEILMRTTGTEVDLEAIGASLFLRSGSPNKNIVINPFNTDGKVVIGRTTPAWWAKFSVVGDSSFEGEVLAHTNVGIGVDPQRQLHMRGTNALFRMDRPNDGPGFLLVRTDAAYNPIRTFAVASTATDFQINDLGTAVSGGGNRRMTINNAGNAIFTGSVTAKSFVTSSSRRFKQDIAPLTDALALVSQLQGVRFVWKDSGRPAVGLIAEDVAAVLPEVVERDADGQAAGVNYMELVAVLIEAVKAQQAEVAALKAQVTKLESAQARTVSLEARLAQIESLLAGGRLPVDDTVIVRADPAAS